MVNIWLIEWLKLPLSNFFICHKYVIANLHKSTTITVRMTIFTKFWIMLNEIKLIKHLTIWTTRITNGSSFWTTITTPPVFAAIIKENSFTWIYTTRRSLLFAADIRHFCINALFCKLFLPQFSRFNIFLNIIFRRTYKTRYVQSLRIKTNFLSQKRPHPANLLFLKIVAQTPVSEHLKKRCMTIIANVVDVLRSQTRLRIGNSLTFGMRLTKQVWNHRLHSGARK